MDQAEFFWQKKILKFAFVAVTSRNILDEKISYLFYLKKNDFMAASEISLIPNLSPDDPRKIEEILQLWADQTLDFPELPKSFNLDELPALNFGIDVMLANLNSQKKNIYFDNFFTQKKTFLRINGLIWMDQFEKMKEQVDRKISQGFSCLKLKISAKTWDQDLALLNWIATKYPDINLRLDANGSFSFEEVFEKLNLLTNYKIEYLEQPIAPNQTEKMAEICVKSTIPIALDEELIGKKKLKKEILAAIRPQFLILKPSLLGGFKESENWLNLAKTYEIPCRITSALESNIGLNALAQFTSEYADLSAIHGLGTGGLYLNNTVSLLNLIDERLFFN